LVYNKNCQLELLFNGSTAIRKFQKRRILRAFRGGGRGKRYLPTSFFFLLAGEVARRWNQILPSLLNTFEKLNKLGFTYYNGTVSVILPEKEDGHV